MILLDTCSCAKQKPGRATPALTLARESGAPAVHGSHEFRRFRKALHAVPAVSVHSTAAGQGSQRRGAITLAES
jgi:hypothetical protein